MSRLVVVLNVGCGPPAAATACPKAASVGARMAANSAASHKVIPPTSKAAASIPSAIVNGKPIPRIRTGRSCCLRNSLRSIRAASVNKTQASVMVANFSTSGVSMSCGRIAKPQRPTSNPSKTKTIGAVMMLRSMRPEIIPNAKIERAMTKIVTMP